MKIANVQEMIFIDKSIIHRVSHLYTWYQPYKKVVPQVILNFKRSSNEECIPHYKSSSLSSEWPMLWHRGKCPTNWYQGQRSYVWYLKGYTSCVIPTYVVVSIKNARFKCQPSIPSTTLCIKWCTPFMEIDDKGGEIGTKIWNMKEALGRSWIWTWMWTKREQQWGMEKDQNSWTKEAHK